MLAATNVTWENGNCNYYDYRCYCLLNSPKKINLDVNIVLICENKDLN
jgi:hypothetical protein